MIKRTRTRKIRKILGGRTAKPKTPKRKSPEELSPLSPLSPFSYHSISINPNAYQNDEHIIALARKGVQDERRRERRSARRHLRRYQRRNARIEPLSRGIPLNNLMPTYRTPDPRGHMTILQRLIRRIRGEEY